MTILLNHRINDTEQLFRRYIWHKDSGPSALLTFLSTRFHYLTGQEWLDKLTRQILHLNDPSGSSESADSALCLKINGAWVTSTDLELSSGDVIENACRGSDEPPINASYEVVHHDADVLVVLKPPNIPVSQGGRYLYNTLEQLMNRTYRLFDNQKIYVVHRIDKETSGIVLFALNLKSAQILTSQGWHFRKRYEAIIAGRLPLGISHMAPTDCLHIRYAIIRAREIFGEDYCLDIPCLRKIRMRATENSAEDADGECVSILEHSTGAEVPVDSIDVSHTVSPWKAGAKFAYTKISLIHHDESLALSLIKCKLETGRTHQIRVHVSAIGCPILGDKLYGQSNERYLQLTRREIEPVFDIPGGESTDEPTRREKIPQHLLHACEISFRHPTTKEIMTFASSAVERWKSHPSSLVREFTAGL